MKRFYLFLFGLMATMCAMAQSLVATLSHEGNVSTYYGAQALLDAYNASVDGDLITLSSGQFNACDISKAVTIRGAGFDSDAITGRQPTFLTGNFNLYAPAENPDGLITIEGIYHNFDVTYFSNVKTQFIKCRFKHIKYDPARSNSNNSYLTLINCRVAEEFSLYSNCQATCVNSLIRHPYSYDNTSNFECINCIIFDYGSVKSSSFTNCGLFHPGGDAILGSSNMANYCIGFHYYNSNIFRNIPTGTNTVVTRDVFESFDDNAADSATYRLTEEAAAQYLGNDGTQVGMYGGLLPFNSTLNNPQITKFKVAEKSTADGKLSIDITVSIPE